MYKGIYQKNGFTLIELAIVLSLIMILTAIAAPSLRTFATSRQLKSSASEIRSLLMFARDVSITENTNYLVLFDLDEQRYWLASRDNFDIEDMSASLATNRSQSTSSTTSSSEDEEFSLSRTSNLLGIPKEPKNGIQIAMISVMHGSSEPNQVTTGTDYVGFTPTGTAEEATIYLANSNESVMSISVDQATGHVRVEKVSDADANEMGLSFTQEE